jgi:hypothetical protein
MGSSTTAGAGPGPGAGPGTGVGAGAGAGAGAEGAAAAGDLAAGGPAIENPMTPFLGAIVAVDDLVVEF